MAFIALLAGLLLSGTAAYYSIIGLIAIFPGALFPIALMGGSLEFAKLVAASWLYRNWNIAPKFIRIYFIFAVLILMLITSLGIFGFLSKVHLENSVGVADNTIQISTIEQQIASEQRILNNAQRSLESLDAVVANSFMDGARIRAQQRNERAALNATIEESSVKITELNSRLEPFRRSNIESEAKIGPLKYIAELIYGKEEAKNYFDSAVRAVIILIVFVFDPLAVLLLIAANISWMNRNVNRSPARKEKKKVAKKIKEEYNSKSIKDNIYNFMMKEDFGFEHTDKPDKPKKDTVNLDGGGF